MNRRPSITNIVSSFEKVITKNREYGCDRDILGNNNKSSIPPLSRRRASYSHSSSRKEWKSSRELGEMKKKSFPAQQRRITLVDAMSASTARRRQSLGEFPRSHHTPLVSKQKEPQSVSLEKSSNSAISNINKKKQVTTKKKKAQGNKKVIPKKPKTKAPTTIQPRKKEEVVEDDDEMKALREKIASLQAQLQQVEHYEKRQLAAIAQDKTEQKARYRNRQSSKRNVLVAAADESRNLQKRQARKQQKMIEKLRHDNKQLRQESRDLVTDIRQLHESNASLERAHQTTQTYFGELSEFHDSEKDIYKRYSDVLPKFQGKVSELDGESAMRGAWIAMEQNIQDKYQKCQESIVALVEARCDDEDLVDNVVRLSLGLEIE